ncbi:hypothetical protein ACHAXN_005793 [Cyclotella atomus]
MQPKHSIRPLPNPEECQGYPPSMMMDKPDCELNFLLNVNNDNNSHHCLACSFILRGETLDSINLMSGEHLLSNSINHIDKTKPVIIVCHGSFSWRNQMLISNLASKLSIAMDVHTLRFDFTGNGHSTGEWKFGNLELDYQDLCSIVDFVHSLGCEVGCIIGHSQGSASVLQCAARCATLEKQGLEIPCTKFVNLAGRYHSPSNDTSHKSFNQSHPLFDEDDMSQLKDIGYFYLKNTYGEERNDRFKITKEQVDKRTKRDTNQIMQHLQQSNTRIHILTIHGSKDEMVSVDNAYKFDRELASGNHILHIIEGAGHNFNGIKYHSSMVDAISSFVRK